MPRLVNKLAVSVDSKTAPHTTTTIENDMPEALETLYAMRIIYWVRRDKALYRQINADIKSLEACDDLKKTFL